MKVLSLNYKIFKYFGLIIDDDNKNRLVHKLYILIGIQACAIMFVGFFAGLCYFIEYVEINLEAALYAGFATAAIFSTDVTMISLFFFRRKLTSTFEHFQTIYEQCIAGFIQFNVLNS